MKRVVIIRYFSSLFFYYCYYYLFSLLFCILFSYYSYYYNLHFIIKFLFILPLFLSFLLLLPFLFVICILILQTPLVGGKGDIRSLVVMVPRTDTEQSENKEISNEESIFLFL